MQIAGPQFPHGEFIARHFRINPKTGLAEPKPYKTFRARNAYVNGGGVAILNLIAGAGGTAFNAANAWIGVGDGSAATVASMTDLQATLAGTHAIVSSTNATPIVVTDTAHGYSNGDTVTVVGHLVNTAANGTWVIGGVTTNTYQLLTTVGNGVGGATGTVAKGNRLRRGMDATFPSLVGQKMTWEATYASGEAEWAAGILEVALFNGSLTTATMGARIAQNMGLKAAATILKMQYIIQIP